ncbi:thiamine phosphate synthase [Bacillus sp. FJAT-42376]|uniref:thiamine phosphate synthase n=1 Tax=Bacillus sp. FJAT-42376 TaxID=2014076 RepID=UPI000F5098F3|nr:thiamine phosphate synthase [Bacillus sp. FJAT-42376]AZB42488.1 thiamine phosphate synthase [Bacillus sp. FJAT-42376]
MNRTGIKEHLPLYFIAGTQDCHGNIAEILKEAIKGGITLFQFREKGKGSLHTEAEIEQLAAHLLQICKSSGIPFIVNDDVELALKIGADGVHVGQDDAAAGEIRDRLKGKILGVSVHSLAEAERALADGADYIGVGPVYPTSSKEDAKEAKGTLVIEQIHAADIGIPMVGIGGITADNAKKVVLAGASGISVISSISRAEHPLDAAAKLRKAVNGTVDSL